MQIHSYAKLFPMMDEDSLREFTASVRDNGLEQPIVTYEGKILDGRNRSIACTNSKVTPEYAEYEGDDPLGYVLRTNLHRRHLTTSQRAAVAASLANLETGDNQHNSEGVSIDTASTMLNVGRATTARAKKVIDSGDEQTIEAVKSGDMTVNAAVKKLAPAPEDKLSESEQQNRKLKKLWDKTGDEGRELFLNCIGATL